MRSDSIRQFHQLTQDIDRKISDYTPPFDLTGYGGLSDQDNHGSCMCCVRHHPKARWEGKIEGIVMGAVGVLACRELVMFTAQYVLPWLS